MDSRPSGLKEEDMIERVARAIDAVFEPGGSNGAHTFSGQVTLAARAAIEAMREPTEAMVTAWFTAQAAESGNAMWNLMIDAALKSPSGV